MEINCSECKELYLTNEAVEVSEGEFFYVCPTCRERLLWKQRIATKEALE